MAFTTYTGTVVEASAGRPATTDLAGFAAKTYTKVNHLLDWAEMGDTSQDVTETTLDGRTWHTNGPLDGGTIAFTFLEDGADAGQTILLTANNGSAEVSVKVTDADGKVSYCFGRVANIRDRARSAPTKKGKTGEFRVNSATIRT